MSYTRQMLILLSLAYVVQSQILLGATIQNLGAAYSNATKSQTAPAKKISVKKAVVKDAMQEIRRVVVDDPDIFTVSCTYKVFNGEPILTTKRLYYKQYRKKSDYVELAIPKKFLTKTPESVFEVTFKRPQRNKFLSLVHKHPMKKNWRLESEQVALPVGYFA